MSTMVEKVARALCEAADDNWDWSIFYIVDANDTAETGRDVYRDMARAAIEAMMEPSKMMVAAGYEKINENIDFWNYESGSGYSVEDIAPSETWRAMIQAALKEEAQ